jgi:hypothetical protein
VRGAAGTGVSGTGAYILVEWLLCLLVFILLMFALFVLFHSLISVSVLTVVSEQIRTFLARPLQPSSPSSDLRLVLLLAAGIMDDKQRRGAIHASLRRCFGDRGLNSETDSEKRLVLTRLPPGKAPVGPALSFCLSCCYAFLLGQVAFHFYAFSIVVSCRSLELALICLCLSCRSNSV